MTTAPSKTKIFTTAWAVARAGAAKFGGSARSYFAAALRQAYAYIRERMTRETAAAKPVEPTTADKVRTLAGVVFAWPKHMRGTFTSTFVWDNFDRVEKYGAATKFSPKQVALINEMYAKHCH